MLSVLGAEEPNSTALHRANGVELRPGADVAEIIGAARSTGVRLSDGDVVAADTVVIGVGITPNIELAASAGLPVDNGIVVDEHLATIDPDVFAAGDVANTYYPLLGTHLRLEHWSAALNQGPVAAANMMGTATSYDKVPYFFSDQYDSGMEYSGYVPRDGYDEVVFRGDVASGEFIAFWMKGDGAGRHERRHMGCHRRDRGAGALRCATRPIEAGRPRGSVDRPDASALRSQRLPRSGPRTETTLDGGACCGPPTGRFRVGLRSRERRRWLAIVREGFVVPSRVERSAACSLGQVGADDAIEHGVDVEVSSQLSGRCGVLDDGGERSAVLDEKSADQCGETGVLVGQQRRHATKPDTGFDRVERLLDDPLHDRLQG